VVEVVGTAVPPLVLEAGGAVGGQAPLEEIETPEAPISYSSFYEYRVSKPLEVEYFSDEP
jgi:hypothetical protein